MFFFLWGREGEVRLEIVNIYFFLKINFFNVYVFLYIVLGYKEYSCMFYKEEEYKLEILVIFLLFISMEFFLCVFLF